MGITTLVIKSVLQNISQYDSHLPSDSQHVWFLWDKFPTNITFLNCHSKRYILKPKVVLNKINTFIFRINIGQVIGKQF